MTQHLARTARKREHGDERLGWKIGFRGPAVQSQLGLTTLTTTALNASSLLPEAATHSLKASTQIALEVEIAVVLRREIAATMDDATILECVAELAPAIEIVDLDLPMTDVAPIIAQGVFHRALQFGDWLDAAVLRTQSDGGDPLVLRTQVNDDPATRVEAGTPRDAVARALRQAAQFLDDHTEGESLQAADLVLLGAVGPLHWPEGGDRLYVDLERGASDDPIDRRTAAHVRMTGSRPSPPPHRDTDTRPPDPSESEDEPTPSIPALRTLDRHEAHLLAKSLSAIATQLARDPSIRVQTPPFSESIVREIETSRVLTRDARARQLRRVAQLLWHEDVESIKAAMAGHSAADAARKAREHAAEAWRTRLLSEGDDALMQLVKAHPRVDIQLARSLMRRASSPDGGGRAKRARTELLRCIRAAASDDRDDGSR